MQDLKQKLADQGLVGSLTIRETGQKIPLRFARGEMSKLCKLELGPTSADVELRLVGIHGATPEQPNLSLVLWSAQMPSAVASVGDESRIGTEGALDDEATALAKAKTAFEIETAAFAKDKTEFEAEVAAFTKVKAEFEAVSTPVSTPVFSTASIPVETPTSSSQPITPARKQGR